MVLDKDKKAQALCTLFSMKTLHNHVLPKGHLVLQLIMLYQIIRSSQFVQQHLMGTLLRRVAITSGRLSCWHPTKNY